MLELLWLIPILPLAGFVVLALAGQTMPRLAVAGVGVGSVGLSAILALLVGGSFMASPPPDHAFAQTLWTWISVGNFTPRIDFYLDALSTIMMLVVTVVGFLILLYSAEFMERGEGYGRFFAYMDLFVGAMLILVLAKNLLLLYLGWEGVGLCSYLLIGFWYKNPANGRAARKAFIVTRIGDTALAIGLFLLFTQLGTLDIQEVMRRAGQQWLAGSALAVSASALLLGGALGKSAQLPLQTWLPDAMAGPTPVSALIHAATMVTAGVYLIARTNVLFTLAPPVQSAVAMIGALTLLYAGFSALTQWDIKRVLAYSTISQVGYMFLALGVGAWSAGIFHFMTHAFFKSLLFLAAGVVMMSLNDEHDMFKMGGLRKRLPVAFWTFLIGSASLSALPLVTAGFYSKDAILYGAWASDRGGFWLWSAGLAGALLTSLYSFRMVFLIFCGPMKEQPQGRSGWRIAIPLAVLAVLALVGGFIQTPRTLGEVTILGRFLGTALPKTPGQMTVGTETMLDVLAALASVGGVGLAYVLFLRNRNYAADLTRTRAGVVLHRFWFNGWGFDWLYYHLLVAPYLWLARVNRRDFVDSLVMGVAQTNEVLHRGLSAAQTGQLNWYATGIVIGAIIVVAMAVLL